MPLALVVHENKKLVVEELEVYLRLSERKEYYRMF